MNVQKHQKFVEMVTVSIVMVTMIVNAFLVIADKEIKLAESFALVCRFFYSIITGKDSDYARITESRKG